jgi:hypothetical protein
MWSHIVLRFKDFFGFHSEFAKYLIRFGLVLVIALPILLLTQGGNAVRVISYKIALAVIAVGLAELVWALFFKPVYGKTEATDDKEIMLFGVMLFRGLLYAAIILALTLGL